MIKTNSECEFSSGKELIAKVKAKKMENELLPENFYIECRCGEQFTMKTHVMQCPNCNLEYGVTPCSNDNVDNVVTN